MISEREAIEKLIRDVDRADRLRNVVPRRIFLLFAIIVPLSVALLIFSVRHARPDRPVTPRQP